MSLPSVRPRLDRGLPRYVEPPFRMIGQPEQPTTRLVDSQALNLTPGAFRAVALPAIGVAQVAVPHGLGRVPAIATVTMTTTGAIWFSAATDRINVYLTADAAGRLGTLYVK